jgi:hypothetical protein
MTPNSRSGKVDRGMEIARLRVTLGAAAIPRGSQLSTITTPAFSAAAQTTAKPRP